MISTLFPGIDRFLIGSELVPNHLISWLIFSLDDLVMINLGREDEVTEFKESISQLDRGIRSLSAMLNRHNHGTVYFGVNDEGEVIGWILVRQL